VKKRTKTFKGFTIKVNAETNGKAFPKAEDSIGKTVNVYILDAATILVAASGLAMDAFTVSIAYGITTKNNGKTNAIKMASSFAFQTGMPILGRLAGVEILNLIAGFLTTGSRLGYSS